MNIDWLFKDGQQLILTYAPVNTLAEVGEVGKPGDAVVCLDVVGPVFVNQIIDQIRAENIVQGDQFGDMGKAGEADIAIPVVGLAWSKALTGGEDPFSHISCM